MKNLHSATKDNNYGQQKENINKSEEVRLYLAGHDPHACPSNTISLASETKKLISITMVIYTKTWSW